MSDPGPSGPHVTEADAVQRPELEEAYRNTTVLDFDENAAKIFQDLKYQKIRIGSMDLKIAAIAISQTAILVSRNLKDFEAVPNLVVNDWTR